MLNLLQTVKTSDKGIESMMKMTNENTLISSHFSAHLKVWKIQNSYFNNDDEFAIKALLTIKTLASKLYQKPFIKYSLVNFIFNRGINYVHTFDHDTNACSLIELSPNERTFASGSHDGSIRVYDLNILKCIKYFSAHLECVRCLSKITINNVFYLISGSDDATIKFWNLESWSNDKILTGHDDWVYSLIILIWDVDDHTLISGSADTGIKLWNLESNACIKTFRHYSTVYKLAQFEPIEKHNPIIIGGSADFNVKLWNIKNKECIYSIYLEDTGMNTFLPITHNNYTLLFFCNKKTDFTLFDFKIHKKINVNNFQYEKNNKINAMVKIYEDDKKVIFASAGENDVILIWELKFI
jgi:WD40 repeat protein